MKEVNNARISMGGDTVQQALNDRVNDGEMDQQQADIIMWYFGYCRENDLTLKESASQIGYDSSTLWRVWQGEYGASVTNICAKIQRVKDVEIQRQDVMRLAFVETSTWNTISSVCQNALASQSIAFIFGESQIGKTTCLMEYASRHNHGTTKYIRMPASSGIRLFAQEFARSCYVSPDQSFENLRDRILRAIGTRTLVVVDEVHQVFTSYQKGSAIKVLEFIREVYDRTQCGMVLCGTDVLAHELQQGKLAIMLKQFNRRGLIKVNLPSMTPKSDLLLVASKFGLGTPSPDAQRIITDMIAYSGLGMYIKFLQAAATKAKRSKKPVTWDHFVDAYEIIQRLSINT